MYRTFSRVVWRANKSWPDGFEPNAVPMDSCRTLAEFDSRDEAIEFCEERNEKWREYKRKIDAGYATDKQRELYYTAPRYEFTEI